MANYRTPTLKYHQLMSGVHAWGDIARDFARIARDFGKGFNRFGEVDYELDLIELIGNLMSDCSLLFL